MRLDQTDRRPRTPKAPRGPPDTSIVNLLGNGISLSVFRSRGDFTNFESGASCHNVTPLIISEKKKFLKFKVHTLLSYMSSSSSSKSSVSTFSSPSISSPSSGW